MEMYALREETQVPCGGAAAASLSRPCKGRRPLTVSHAGGHKLRVSVEKAKSGKANQSRAVSFIRSRKIGEQTSSGLWGSAFRSTLTLVRICQEGRAFYSTALKGRR